MPRVTQNRPTAAVRATREPAAKSLQFDLTKKKELRGEQVKSGASFTVKLPPGEWTLGGLNGRDMFEFREKGEKKFLPLEQYSPTVSSGVELRAKGAKGWNSLGQLTFTAEKGKKELFLEMRVDGGKAPKNERVTIEPGRGRSVGGDGSGAWVPRGRTSSVSGGGSGGWGGGGVGGGGS